jgi:hypothetical protein
MYGVKDDTGTDNLINWSRFRDLSVNLQKKTDSELLEMLYCILAMCTKQQGQALSSADEDRAASIQPISKKSAEKLMNRIHLMRKVHALITTGVKNVLPLLKLCSNEHMPKGWTEAHDEHLLIVVDTFGLDNILSKVKMLPKLFDAITSLEETDLRRRVIEICTTLESGKWRGKASTEMIDDDDDRCLSTIVESVQSQSLKGSRASPALSATGGRKPRKVNTNKRIDIDDTVANVISSSLKTPTTSSSAGEKSSTNLPKHGTSSSKAEFSDLEARKMLELLQQPTPQKVLYSLYFSIYFYYFKN